MTQTMKWWPNTPLIQTIQLYLLTTLLLSLQTLAQYQQQQQQYGMPQQGGAPQHSIHSYGTGQQGGQQQQQYQQVPHQAQGGQQQQQYQQQGQAVAAGGQGEHVPQYQQTPQHGSNVLHDSQRIHDRQHLKEHLHGAVGADDLSKMSEEELQFHYFKMHDNDNNNKLDGSELIKSLIHWHVEESKHLGAQAPASGTTKIFTDQELEQMIDPILDMDDKNRDGYIDYPEFVAAQKARGF